MSLPVVVLKKDHGLDKMSLECIGNGGQRILQVDLSRDAKVDGLALDYNHSFATSGIVPPGRQGPQSPRRKRRKFTNSFLPDVSLQATTLSRSTLKLYVASKHEGSENPSILGSRSIYSPTVASKQDDSLQAATADRGSRQTMADFPEQDGCELSSLTNQPTHSSNTSKQEKISKEDFMALLCLAPTHVAARIRTCTRHRASKYLHIKTRSLWNKLCRERNDHRYVPDPETAQKPSFVLLERNEIIDSLALRSVPQSIHLKTLTKSAIHRKHLCMRKTRSLNVVLEKDPGLDRLTVETPAAICTSSTSNSTETIAVPSEPVGASMVSLPADSEINAMEKTGWSVQINRDSGLGMLALVASNSVCESVSADSPGVSSCETNAISRVSENAGLKNLSIKIERDLFIDQLALQNSNISVAGSCSDCNNTPVPYHHSTLVPPSEFITSISTLIKGHREGMENSFKHNCKTKLGLLPNFRVKNDSKIPDIRKAVIKLRRISTGEWSVIQPQVELNRNAYDSLSSNAIGHGLETSDFKSSTPKSTDSKNTTKEFTRNPCIYISRIPFHASNSSRSEGGLGHETRSQGIQSVTNHSRPPTSAYEQQSPKKMEEMSKTVNLASCSKSSRRAKSVSSEEPPQQLHHNENKNPRKVIPPIKSIDMRGTYSSNVTVVEPRGLRKTSQRVLENYLPKGPHSKPDATRFRCRQNNVCCNPMKPSVSRYMSVKKPLRIKSEFYSTFNISQPVSSKAKSEQGRNSVSHR